MEHEIVYSSFKHVQGVRDLFEEHSEKLNVYLESLLWWNKKINLVSRDVSRETLRNHLEHSLALCFSEYFKRSLRIIDAGTGGGLPGIPLAISFPEKKVVLNDVVSKKITACKQMVYKLGLENIIAKAGSIEQIDLSENDLVVSKHAFKINDLVRLLEGKSWKNILLLKGKEVESELEGITEPLKINVIALDSFNNIFYDGKAMVEISKTDK